MSRATGASSISPPAELPFAEVTVSGDPAEASDAWAELESIAPISAYQTRRWVLPWIATIGRASGIAPMLVAARDRDGRPIAFLPLGVRRFGGLRTAAFLGGKDANINLGLFRPGVHWSQAAIAALLRRAAGPDGAGPDLYMLANQPHRWAGADNPLALLQHQPSPSFGSVADLDGDAEALLSQRLSGETRKKIRKKGLRLEGEIGALRHVVASDVQTARDVLAAFHAQKAARMRALGLSNVFGDAAVQAFLDRAATGGPAGDEPGIELHALYAGSRIVATFGGAAHAGHFSGMFNSFETESRIARSSPGELLLMKIVAEKCAAGFRSFDLGVGEASYKAAYCDRTEPLFDTLFPITAAGHAFGLAAGLQQRLKRGIKQTPWLWATVGALRRLKRGRG